MATASVDNASKKELGPSNVKKCVGAATAEATAGPTSPPAPAAPGTKAGAPPVLPKPHQPGVGGESRSSHQKPKLVLAKALYDNAGDSRDELTFVRGDVLTVLDSNPEGLTGWWLCLLNGRRGIAPGNRLQLMSSRPPSGGGGTTNSTSAGTGINGPVGTSAVAPPPPGSTNGTGGVVGAGGTNNVSSSNSNHQEDLYQTPPSQQNGGVNWHRRSWHMHPNKVITPQKLGGVYIYDQPNHGFQDYDVPPSRYFPAAGSSATSGGQNGQGGRLSGEGAPNALYDTPSGAIRAGNGRNNTAAMDAGGMDVYDVPPSSHAHIPIGSLSPSNRSSVTSVGSTTTVSSGTSSSGGGPGGGGGGGGGGIGSRWPPSGGAGSHPGSTCGSARSSTEMQDIYDVPPPAKAVTPKSPLALNELKYGSGDSGCPQLSAARCIMEDYDTPANCVSKHGKMAHRDTDSGIVACNPSGYKEECAYDVPPISFGQQHSNISSSKVEHDIDNIYDHPPNNAPAVPWALHQHHGQHHIQHQEGRVVAGLSVAGGALVSADGSTGVYDIPPQVTRDSAISVGSLMDEVSSRLSSCSVASSSGGSGSSFDVPPVPYDELPLDLDAALELLVKLQQEVHSATSRLLSFVHSGWRAQQELEPKLYNVKLGCLGVQATLQEFVDFGQGALANSARADDKKLVKKLSQLLEPLQESMRTVSKGMRHLNDLNWSISELVSTSSQPIAIEQQDDSLGVIVTQAKEVPGMVRTMASCIQGNSTLLFKRQQHVNGSSQNSSAAPSANASPKKVPPPVRPKPPPATLPKPSKGPVATVQAQVAGTEVSLERRASNMQDRPLPAPPVRTDTLSPDHQHQQGDVSAVYEVPHGDEDDQSPNGAGPGDNAATGSAKDGNNKYNTKAEFLEDYDYVHLESNRPPPASDSTVSGGRVDGSAAEDETDSGIVVTSGNESGSGSGGSGGSATGSSGGLTSRFQERLQQVQQGGAGGALLTQDNNNVTKTAAAGPTAGSSSTLHPNDRQLLSFYASQVGAHTAQLVNAIDAFFQCVEYNQPPKIFIAHSKNVVMAAHRMVYICDTIHRNLLSEEIRVKVMACANYLCDCLKLVVGATKSAALQYPSVVSVQEMVDRVVDVSHAANEIKLVVTQAANL